MEGNSLKETKAVSTVCFEVTVKKVEYKVSGFFLPLH